MKLGLLVAAALAVSVGAAQAQATNTAPRSGTAPTMSGTGSDVPGTSKNAMPNKKPAKRATSGQAGSKPKPASPQGPAQGHAGDTKHFK